VIDVNFTAKSRLMLFAPHPDDEALACSIVLQHAVRAGAAIRVVYATDGDDNPWPQRVLERKWRLNAADRKRWGKLRRAEAQAALRVLGASAADARFLALPDQRLTALLLRDCRSILARFAAMITEWAPTHLLVPSIADTHPDHSALAVMLRIVVAEFLSNGPNLPVWSYCVHGKSPVFFERAQKLRQSESEMAIKRAAIRCHKTQLKLSRKRFLAYATRPERLLKLAGSDEISGDASIRSVSRKRNALHLKLRLSTKAMGTAQPALFVLGHDQAGALRCLEMQLPVRSSRVEAFDCVTDHPLCTARYRGHAFAGELAVPIDIFSPTDPVFVKLERRSWFFDEAGWMEVPATVRSEPVAVSKRHPVEEPTLAAR
jgi:LmbE family N-acetylglucosaminyl deacetylase